MSDCLRVPIEDRVEVTSEGTGQFIEPLQLMYTLSNLIIFNGERLYAEEVGATRSTKATTSFLRNPCFIFQEPSAENGSRWAEESCQRASRKIRRREFPFALGFR